MDRITGAINVLYVLDNTAFVVKLIAFSGTSIFENNSHTAVEKRQLLQAFIEHVVFKLSRLKNLSVGFESCLSSYLRRLSSLSDGSGRYPSLVFLLINFTFAVDFYLRPLG